VEAFGSQNTCVDGDGAGGAGGAGAGGSGGGGEGGHDGQGGGDGHDGGGHDGGGHDGGGHDGGGHDGDGHDGQDDGDGQDGHDGFSKLCSIIFKSSNTSSSFLSKSLLVYLQVQTFGSDNLRGLLEVWSELDTSLPFIHSSCVFESVHFSLLNKPYSPALGIIQLPSFHSAGPAFHSLVHLH